MDPTTELSLHVVIGLMALALLAAIVWYFVRRGRRSKPGTGTMSLADLHGLEKKSGLTPEELKRVREAMARQYLRTQEEERQRQAALPPAASGVEMLALEAERLEAELAGKRAATDGVHAPVPARIAPVVSPPPQPLTMAAPPPPPDAPPAEALPSSLKLLVDKSQEEIDDLRAAGFIGDADYERLLRARGQRP